MRFVVLLAGLFLTARPGAPTAQTPYPDKPIRVVAPCPPGSVIAGD